MGVPSVSAAAAYIIQSREAERRSWCREDLNDRDLEYGEAPDWYQPEDTVAKTSRAGGYIITAIVLIMLVVFLLYHFDMIHTYKVPLS